MSDPLALRDPQPAVPLNPPVKPGVFQDPPTTRAQLRALLTKTGISRKHVNEAAGIAQPGIQLVQRGYATDTRPGGETQVGGFPLMRPDAPWPTQGGRPLSLVAQIDLDALRAPRRSGLPRHGLLQFFAELTLDPRPDDEFPEQHPTVRWQRERAGLIPRTDGTAGWGPARYLMDFRDIVTVPLYGDTVFRHWDAAEHTRFDAFGEYQTVDQVGGWAYEFQEDPLLSIAMRAAGVVPERVLPDAFPIDGTPVEKKAYNKRWYDAALARVDPSKWTLLLQLESAPGASMWGDAGVLWFAIRKDDLAARRFDRVLGDWASH